ncbi:UBX domain-containing protein 7-like [Amphiura filiformis]|uniref:UBX domain-containing protein 7-like n=1 Tax=Amphiura filiformis TaxID=82378 RepID=UPI003B216B18
MASKSRIKGLKALAVQFAAVTGASEEIGRKLLDICNGNLEMAIGMQLEGGVAGQQAKASGAAESLDGAGPSFASRMAIDDDNVRPPDPQKQEVLVPDVPSFGPRPKRRGGKSSVFDKFRDFQAETRQQEEMIRRGETNRGLAAKKRTLEDLFRPPLDIMHKGTLNTAREHGQSQCKWVIVNVQNVQEFSCQQLNRDVWSDSTVKSIINESFVFWQVYHDSDEGQRFMQFYKINEFPYVAVLDPRTGEQMASWTRLDNMSFCDLAIQFLSDHPMFDKDGTSPPPNKRLKTQTSIIDASEDSQLEAAIAASLAESSSTANSHDDNKEPATPTSSSSIPSSSVRRKIISIPDDDDDEDSDTFHSVNGSSSEDEDSNNEDDVKVVERKVIVKPQAKKALSEPSRTDNKDGTKDKETGEKTVSEKDSKKEETDNTNATDQSSNGKEPVVEESEAAKSVAPCRQNGASELDASVPDKPNESSVASEADAIDPSNACNLMLRFPDGRRKQVTLQATDSLLSLVKLVSKEGFSNERYELVTNFPRRRLSYLDINTNLKAAGLFPQESIFIQER